MKGIKIKELIRECRKDQTQVGVRKIHLDIKEGLQKHNIKFGRDKLFKLRGIF